MTALHIASLVLNAAVAGRLIWKALPARTMPLEGPDPSAEMRVMTVATLLISGASDWNKPVPMLRQGFGTVEASPGKRTEVFDGSGDAPFLTETDRVVQTLGGFAAGIAVRLE